MESLTIMNLNFEDKTKGLVDLCCHEDEERFWPEVLREYGRARKFLT